MANTSKRGFASMEGEKQRLIASKGGKAAHAKGTAHEWSSDEARAAGRKGGESRGNRARDTNSPGRGIAASAVASPLADHALATSFLANAGRSLRTGVQEASGNAPLTSNNKSLSYAAYNPAVVDQRYAGE